MNVLFFLMHRCSFAYSNFLRRSSSHIFYIIDLNLIFFILKFLVFRSSSSAAQRLGVCNTSGSGTDLPAGSGDMEGTHGPLPQNASLFLGFAFMLTASSETDRLTNKLAGNDDEGEWLAEVHATRHLGDLLRVCGEPHPAPESNRSDSGQLIRFTRAV